MDFSGKVSIVTGASQGIGEAIALDLAKNGAETILVDIQKQKLDMVTGKIKDKGGKAFAFEADVTDTAQITSLMEKLVQDHGAIHHLVNNAGITRDSLLMRMKEEEWDSVLEVNLKGVFNFSRALIRHMIRNRYGRIVNISSVVGLTGNPGQTNYSASKAGVLGFTKSLAREVASRGITVNAIAPGFIATAMTENLPEEIQKQFLSVIPVGRFGTPNEVAQTVRFLLSEEASYITGQVININGGMFM
ncbi:MAG: 3-oxoacyl-[acyl-carrier-protein] reductase [Candidatus Aminicenantes bacterium]|nr:MAG: 3-oxoacyl-[acyl-carrier-protein] reductase [Candidatus Aminicenantes bacterium]